MPLNGDAIGTAIAGIVKSAAPPAGTPVTDADLITLWQDIMTAIYADIVASAVVTSTVAVASVTLVTPGTGASGPGAGTAIGGIT